MTEKESERARIRALLLSDRAVEALTLHLQTEWAGPYMARVSDFTDDEVKAGKLREADQQAHNEAKAEARRAIDATLREALDG